MHLLTGHFNLFKSIWINPLRHSWDIDLNIGTTKLPSGKGNTVNIFSESVTFFTSLLVSSHRTYRRTLSIEIFNTPAFLMFSKSEHAFRWAQLNFWKLSKCALASKQSAEKHMFEARFTTTHLLNPFLFFLTEYTSPLSWKVLILESDWHDFF